MYVMSVMPLLEDQGEQGVTIGPSVDPLPLVTSISQRQSVRGNNSKNPA